MSSENPLENMPPPEGGDSPPKKKRPPRKRGPRSTNRKKSPPKTSAEEVQLTSESTAPEPPQEEVSVATQQPPQESVQVSPSTRKEEQLSEESIDPVATEPTEGVETSLDASEEQAQKRRPRKRRRGRRKKTGSADGNGNNGSAPDTAEAEAATETAVREDEPPVTETTVAALKEDEPEEKSEATESEEEETSPQEENKASILKLLINTEEPEECRIVLLENGKVESFHIETVTHTVTKGNIYKGRIVSIEPNLQAAFVDLGIGKNGFLPFSDIHPEYYKEEVEVTAETSWKDLKIQEVVAKGTEVLVEVVKEANESKGANLTTYLSLPGRFLVLMPGSDSQGISRKLDDHTRDKLRDIFSDFELPEGVGYIIRTASKDVTKTALSKDLKYLLSLWEDIRKRGQEYPTPSLLYKDQDIISRFLRDHFTPEIGEIIVDCQEAYGQVQNFLELLPAKQRDTKVRIHRGSRPIFNLYSIEEQIEQIYRPKVKLPSGGSIVINQTEALVAIDVNSGRTSKGQDFEESIFLANMEAAEELARQLRLRDLGGLIVVDFIDMRVSRHRRELEKKLKASMKRDKAKVDFTSISKFGIIQISRQRLGPPVQTGIYRTCPCCEGRGSIPSVETQALSCMRRLQTGVIRREIRRAECRFPREVADYIQNRKRADLAGLEKQHNVVINIVADPALGPSQTVFDFIES